MLSTSRRRAGCRPRSIASRPITSGPTSATAATSVPTNSRFALAANRPAAVAAFRAVLQDADQATQKSGLDILEVGGVEKDHDRVVAAAGRAEHGRLETRARAGATPPTVDLAHAEAVAVVLGPVRGLPGSKSMGLQPLRQQRAFDQRIAPPLQVIQGRDHRAGGAQAGEAD